MCNGLTHSWTEWINLDSPDGDGDLELFSILDHPLGCKTQSKLNQVQTVDGIWHNQAGQVVHFNDCYGFMCLNREQPNNETCLDYQFRQCCPNRRMF